MRLLGTLIAKIQGRDEGYVKDCVISYTFVIWIDFYRIKPNINPWRRLPWITEKKSKCPIWKTL